MLPKGLGPEALVAHYSADEWEQFIYEVAQVWETQFMSVARLGGTDDGGLDICGFRSDSKLLGDWVCFQCKHYGSDLDRNEVLLEIGKIFEGVILGTFVMPSKYYIVSPKGVKSTFNRKMKNPDTFKSEFLKYYRSGGKVEREFGDHLNRIMLLAESTEFSRFESMALSELVDVHRESVHHIPRFGLPLPQRPPALAPPHEIAEGESDYIGKLLTAYQVELGISLRSVDDIPLDSSLIDDLIRQRRRFYSAESLRLFTRDKLPAHAFEHLVDEIFFGVIDAVEVATSGMGRVRAAMDAAGKVSPAHSPLIAVTQVPDKQGVCHQLAAAEKLSWIVVP